MPYTNNNDGFSGKSLLSLRLSWPFKGRFQTMTVWITLLRERERERDGKWTISLVPWTAPTKKLWCSDGPRKGRIELDPLGALFLVLALTALEHRLILSIWQSHIVSPKPVSAGDKWEYSSYNHPISALKMRIGNNRKIPEMWKMAHSL